MKFELPELGFDFSDLEPVIDVATMEIHHGKHHQGYVNNLNAALEKYDGDLETIEDLLAGISTLPEEIRVAVRNNGGGHYNHSLFWEVIAPGGEGKPTSELMEAIDKSFGSFDEFKTKFGNAAKTRFGSGWAWLGVSKDGGLMVYSTPNQDNSLMSGLVEHECKPILGIDVWEHAYYLNYQNKRADYVDAFMGIINWSVVSEKYGKLLSS